MIDIDAIEARARAVPFDVIPHGPTPTGGLMLCLADDADTSVGRLWGPCKVEIAGLLANARRDIIDLLAEVRRLRQEAHDATLARANELVPEVYVKVDNAHLYRKYLELRAELEQSTPVRIQIPGGPMAEVVSVRVRLSSPRGTEFQSMSVAMWRRQGNGREVLRDDSKGPV